MNPQQAQTALAGPMEEGQLPPGGLLGSAQAGEEPVEPEESDPGYVAARDWAADKMFKSNSAVLNMLKQEILSAKSEKNYAKIVARSAYAAVDEAWDKSEPQMKEENLVPLAAYILEQLWDSVAAVLKKTSEDINPLWIAKSFQLMILRFVRELGGDPEPLRQAFAQVKPGDFQRLVDAANDAMRAEGVAA